MTTELTAKEKSELATLEQTIKKGVTSFVEVGLALGRIRDEKLYRETHKTFADYCDEKWAFKDSRARQLIAAASVAENLKSVTTVTVKSERIARELVGLSKKTQKKALEKAAENNTKPTAKDVKEAVKAQDEENQRGAKDELGKVIPKNCLILWSRRDQVSDMMKDISRIRVQIRQAQDEDDPLFRAINYSTILSQLNQAYADLSAIRPYAVCTCQGLGCKLCHKTGLLGKFAWDKFVPESVK